MALYSDPDERWALGVGRCVLAFGDIEHTSIRCLRMLGGEGLKPRPEPMNPKARLLMLMNLLRLLQTTEAHALLMRCNQLVNAFDARNFVAHNTIHLLGHAFYLEGGGLGFEPALKSSRRPEMTATLSELERFAGWIEEHAWGLTTAAGALQARVESEKTAAT